MILDRDSETTMVPVHGAFLRQSLLRTFWWYGCGRRAPLLRRLLLQEITHRSPTSGRRRAFGDEPIGSSQAQLGLLHGPREREFPLEHQALCREGGRLAAVQDGL
jgi:hypothetical protein